MKKVLFTAALLFGAFAASAQVSVVKEAKSKKGNPAEAAKIIEPALTNPETANDPETWKLAGDFQKAIYDAENDIAYMVQAGIEKNKTADMQVMYNSLLKMFEYYMKCDELEQAKVASGELKKAKLRKKNADILLQVRPNLTNGGIEAFNTQDYQAAKKHFALFVDVVDSPMFADKAQELKADTLVALFANYAALAASMCDPKDTEAVIKYGTIGKENKLEGIKGLKCLAEVYGNAETGDSIKWLATVKEGAEKYPEDDYFVGFLMEYYLQKGLLDEGLSQIDNLLAIQERPYLLYIKTFLFTAKGDYAGAQSIADRIIEMGDAFAAEAYTKKGDCYILPVQALEEENNALSLESPKYIENNAKIKEAYELAKPLYEKAKEVAPEKKELWGRMLLKIYWITNDAKYESLEKELY